MSHREILSELVERMVEAEQIHGPIANLREAHSLVVEEVAELLDALREDDPEQAVEELLDIAVVAVRACQQWR